MHYRTKLIFLSLLLATIFAACSTESERTEPVTTTTGGTPTTAAPAADVKRRDNALVRFINAIPDGGAVDLNDDKGEAFSNGAYKQVTPYKEIHSESHNLRLFPAGNDAAKPLAQNNEVLMAGRHYTVIAMKSIDGKSDLRVISDNLTPPKAGKAKIRVINTSPDAGKIGLYVQGKTSPLFDGVNSQMATSYTEIDPMTTTIDVRLESQKKSLLTIPNAKFEAGKIYTIVITGKANGTPIIEATLIEDHLVAEVTPSPTASVTPTARP